MHKIRTKGVNVFTFLLLLLSNLTYGEQPDPLLLATSLSKNISVSSAKLNVLNEITISGWFFNSTGGNAKIIKSNQFELDLLESTFSFSINLSKTKQVTISDRLEQTTNSMPKWHEFSAEYNGSELRMFIDGEIVAYRRLSEGGSINHNSNPLQISRRESELAEISIWNSALGHKYAQDQFFNATHEVKSDQINCLDPEEPCPNLGWSSSIEAGWILKGLDEGRGMCRELNCWKWDDQDRDKLDMDATQLTFTKILSKENLGVIDNGRYIYVLRKDGTFIIRKYDRAGATCFYQDFRYDKNYRPHEDRIMRYFKNQYLHVRHSQLNGGWDQVWSAGEMLVKDNKVYRLNNESGHFKPTLNNVQFAANYLKAIDVPFHAEALIGDFRNDASAVDESCGASELRKRSIAEGGEPDFRSGSGSDFNPGSINNLVQTADDFMVSNSAATLFGIQFWGVYFPKQPTEKETDYFTIRIFNDKDGVPEVVPIMETDYNGNYRTDTGNILSTGEKVYEYLAQFEPYDLLPNKKYWLSIVNDTRQNGNGFQWGWSTASLGDCGLRGSDGDTWVSANRCFSNFAFKLKAIDKVQ